MSYAPGAPAQIWAIPNDVLDAGAKLTYMAMWSKADHDAQRHPEPTTVWFAAVLDATPAMSLLIGIATMTGAKVRAVRGHLTKLRALGVVDTCGRLVTLTPGCHACHRGGELCHCGVDTRMAEFDAVTARPDAVVSDSAAVVSLQLDPPVPSSPPSPGEDARPTSGKPAESTAHDQAGNHPAPPRRHDLGRDQLDSQGDDSRGRATIQVRAVEHVDRHEGLADHVTDRVARAKREQAPEAMSPLSPELEARLAAASTAAAMILGQTGAGPKSWRALCSSAMTSRGLDDDDAVKLVAHWETAPRPKPPMHELWWSSRRAWLSEALGDDATPSRPQAAPPSSSYADWDEDSLRRDHAQGAGR